MDVTENTDGLPVDTVTEYATISQLFLEPVQTEEFWRLAQLVRAQKDGPTDQKDGPTVISRQGLPGKEFASLLSPIEGKPKLPQSSTKATT